MTSIQREYVPLLVLIFYTNRCLHETAQERIKRAKSLRGDGIDGTVVILACHVKSHLYHKCNRGIGLQLRKQVKKFATMHHSRISRRTVSNIVLTRKATKGLDGVSLGILVKNLFVELLLTYMPHFKILLTT